MNGQAAASVAKDALHVSTVVALTQIVQKIQQLHHQLAVQTFIHSSTQFTQHHGE